MLPNFTIMQGNDNIFVHNKQKNCKIKFGDKILYGQFLWMPFESK